MKKFTFVVFLSFLMIFSSSMHVIYASSGSPLQETDGLVAVDTFEITDGIDLSKDAEATFDQERTISGVAEKDTDLLFVVYKAVYHAEEDTFSYEEQDSYALTVGASGLFSQTVNLGLGENYVEITASKGLKKSIVGTTIKCKDEGVKLELENGRALPGQNSSMPKTTTNTR